MISEEIQKGLSVLKAKDFESPAVHKELIDITVKIILGEESPAKIFDSKPLAGVDRIALKQAHSCLAALFLASAKDDSDADAVLSTLDEEGVPDLIQAYATGIYDKYRAKIRSNVLAGASSVRRPRVVDIDWRLDYYLKNNEVEGISIPVYFVRLHTRNNDGTPGKVEFTCSLEELQDLVAKLKDASKQTERTASLYH